LKIRLTPSFGSRKLHLGAKGKVTRNEAIIRHLGKVTCADVEQIARAIDCRPTTVAGYLTRLKRRYLVRNVTWFDGRKVWVLTEEGARRLEYY
jgi:Mn-dependent DtxR family transcriptional regulator